MVAKHVVTRPAPAFHSDSGRLIVHQVPAAHDNLVWVVANAHTREACVVDGPDAAGAIALCAEHGYRLSTVFNTHIHGDHIGINHDLARLGKLDGLRVIGAAQTRGAVPGLNEAVDDGDEIEVCGVRGHILLTEGHIDGHISLLIDGLLFCGDTLFGCGCGYLFDGPPSKMYDSLSRLRELPADTRVCCAHEYTEDNLRFAYTVDAGNAALRERLRQDVHRRRQGESTIPSTIGLERNTNPFLRFDSSAIKSAVRAAIPDAMLDSEAAVFAATRSLKDRKDYKALADADLPI